MFFIVLLIISWNKSSESFGFCLLKVRTSLKVHNKKEHAYIDHYDGEKMRCK